MNAIFDTQKMEPGSRLSTEFRLTLDKLER